jgi:5-methylcytosine-specific restriction enzyme A
MSADLPRLSKHNRPLTEVGEYISALRMIFRDQLWDFNALHLLKLQYEQPGHCITAPTLSDQTGWSVGEINRIYGSAAKVLRQCLSEGLETISKKAWSALSHGYHSPDKFFYIMHSTLAEALDTLDVFAEDETAKYVHALSTLLERGKITPDRRKILQAHYSAPHHDVTAGELSALMGWPGSYTANLHYGSLGALFAEFLGTCPVVYEGSDTPMSVAYLVKFWNDGHLWHWTMRRGLQQALIELGLVTATPNPSDANEIDGHLPGAAEVYLEGARTTVTVNAYERNSTARRKCIEAHGSICKVCNVDQTSVYGPTAAGRIHVHHLRPLSTLDGTYQVDPIHDLLPVCPNCHAMLHSRNPPLSVTELQGLMHAQAFKT